MLHGKKGRFVEFFSVLSVTKKMKKKQRNQLRSTLFWFHSTRPAQSIAMEPRDCNLDVENYSTNPTGNKNIKFSPQIPHSKK